MDASRFVSSEWGRAVSTGGRHGYVAFEPARLPLTVPLGLRAVRALSEADSALGRLAGAGRLLPNPHLLIGPYLTQEAIASSRIEGTQASLSDVFDAVATGEDPTVDVMEVRNYVLALEHGLERLSSLPMSKRLLLEMHDRLLTGVRGQEKTPGEFRTTQNWIGSPDNRPDTALFVPPTVDNMWPALDDWEKYLHLPNPELPLLVRAALLHYQFETIHPFLDGNGRLGRLFTVLFLVEQQALPAPLLPLSAFLENHRDEYYRRLQAVREVGEFDEWLRFFLTAITEQSLDSLARAERLLDLREQYRQAFHGSRSRASEVIDLLFSNPVLTTRLVSLHLGVTPQGALHLLRQVTDKGILQEVGHGRGTRVRWYGADLMTILDL